VRLLSLLLLLALPVAAEDRLIESPETPINVGSPIPVGFLLAWKPLLQAVRTDSGSGSRFGSDTWQPLRILGRYTSTLLDEKLLVRAELEGGRFQTDTQSGPTPLLGSDGYDVTGRLLGGTAVRISQGFVITASAGVISRYQRGRAVGGAPEIGVFGVTSNMEAEFRIAPAVTTSLFIEGGLAPFPYFAQRNLGDLSDSSEVRVRAQLAFDLTRELALDVGYEFTRWHASFTNSSVFADSGDRALLIESRQHALILGVRFKPPRH
jgi:hypothetical protein